MAASQQRQACDRRREEGGQSRLNDPENKVAVAARNTEHPDLIRDDRCKCRASVCSAECTRIHASRVDSVSQVGRHDEAAKVTLIGITLAVNGRLAVTWVPQLADEIEKIELLTVWPYTLLAA